jgi:hypothetical protein
MASSASPAIAAALSIPDHSVFTTVGFGADFASWSFKLSMSDDLEFLRLGQLLRCG